MNRRRFWSGAIGSPRSRFAALHKGRLQVSSPFETVCNRFPTCRPATFRPSAALSRRRPLISLPSRTPSAPPSPSRPHRLLSVGGHAPLEPSTRRFVRQTEIRARPRAPRGSFPLILLQALGTRVQYSWSGGWQPGSQNSGHQILPYVREGLRVTAGGVLFPPLPSVPGQMIGR